MRGGLTRYAVLVAASSAVAVLLLVAVELALRAFGVEEGPPAYDPLAGFSARVPFFEPYVRDDGRAAYRISSARLVDAADEDGVPPERTFLAEKPANGFRVFVLGGSSAAGFPYAPRYAFGAALAHRLEASLPDLTVEVVNAALPGYASRRLLILAREVAAYEPDVVILYSGHNEWAERRFHERFVEMDPRMFRLREILLTTRLSKLLARWTAGTPSEVESREEAEKVIGEQGQMFRVLGKRSSGEAYATPEEIAERDRLYRANVEEIVRVAKAAGAQVVLATLTQNFADWEPGASEHAADLGKSGERRFYASMQRGHDAAVRGDCRAALDAWTGALAVDPVFAELHYRIAECWRTLGEIDLARAHYRLASDLDRVPHGAPTSYNDFLRELAAREGVVLVDADAALREASADGLVGAEFFNEFVHPNLRAHQLIGRAIARALRDAGIPRPADAWGDADYVDPPPAALYAADPDLAIREHLSWRAVCMLSRRERCVEEQTRALAELGVRLERRRWRP